MLKAGIMVARLISMGAWLVLFVELWPAWAQNPNEPTCNACHEQGQKIQNSAHVSLECAACHPRHETYPHPAGIPKPTCGQCHAKVAGEHARSVHGQALKRGNVAAPDCTSCHGDVHEVAKTSSAAFRKAIPDTCGACHSNIAKQYHASVHGQAVEQGVVDAPVCTTCHGEHSILAPTSAASPVHPSHIRETCAQCHGNVRLSRRFGLPPDRVVSFDASFHGLAAKAGSETVANCASCHGVHNIFPSSNPRSTINPKNLPTTCGKCHAGAGTRFALGPIHQLPGGAEPTAVRWARLFYMVVIPLLIGLMLLHNLGDWVRKLAQIRFGRLARADESSYWLPDVGAEEQAEPRMYVFERLLHALLLVSFVVLAWTGFALRYPDGWWARPLLVWESTWPVRGIVHRIASVVFIVVGALHLVSLVKSERLRRHWQALWPRWQDVSEALLNFRYNLGLRSTRPQLSAHSYFEKIEYWAIVWGGVVMTVTGLMLWGHNLVLTWLPKSVLDFATAVHFYEAVLAVLAILVWHIYAVILDPEVYPMDTAWLTGRSPRQRQSAFSVEEAGASPSQDEKASHDSSNR